MLTHQGRWRAGRPVTSPPLAVVVGCARSSHGRPPHVSPRLEPGPKIPQPVRYVSTQHRLTVLRAPYEVHVQPEHRVRAMSVFFHGRHDIQDRWKPPAEAGGLNPPRD